MSDPIKHECGIAHIRLRKPYAYYLEKYTTPFYGLKKLYVMMEKQKNRGQDGAGVGVIKIDVEPGLRYISRYRSIDSNAVASIFDKIYKKYRKSIKGFKDRSKDADWLLENVAFTGEALLGHLRYGTHGKNSIENCHPMLRQNNWRSRNLVMAGNFNMTNNADLFQRLIELGQHPKEKTDTVTVMEKIGHFLDEENQVNNFLLNYEKNFDINRTLDTFIPKFKNQYAQNFPLTAQIDDRRLIKFIKQFYEAKGSEKAIELLFRILYNERTEIFYPSEQVLRASDGI